MAAMQCPGCGLPIAVDERGELPALWRPFGRRADYSDGAIPTRSRPNPVEP